MPTIETVCEVVRELFYIVSIALGFCVIALAVWVAGLIVHGYSIMPV